MRKAKLFLLSTLHDHLLRMAGPKYENAAKTAYLVVAREIAKLYLPDMQSSIYYSLTARLFDIEQSAAGFARKAPLEYRDAWLCQDLRDTGAMSDCEKAVELVSRLCGNYDWANRHRRRRELDFSTPATIGMLDTLYDVARFYDAPLMFARDEDLLNFEIWFGGDMSGIMEWYYAELYQNVADEADWARLIEQYPVRDYMWRGDHEPFTPDISQVHWKNISILDLKKYDARMTNILSQGDELCVVFTATHSCGYKSVMVKSQFMEKRGLGGNTSCSPR